MSSDYHLELLKNKLNSEKIKLWQPPYTLENNQHGVYPEEMVNRYSEELNLNKEVVISLLEDLRLNALSNLEARNKYQETGIATIKIKVAGGNVRGAPQSLKLLTAETKLNMSGNDFKEQVAQILGISGFSIKLISAGSVIQDNKSLEEQNIKHQSQVMALILSEKERETVLKEEKQAARLQEVRQDTELLSAMDTYDPNNQYALSVADQSGRVLELPLAERKALTLAMTLHEKGRAALKRRDYGEALVFLLEAENEFQMCTADILQRVDNYAVLSLDIGWCYLALNSVSQLPNAESRLRACEACFTNSYGPNLERLTAVKGFIGHESALLVRLHLLQGIVAYHLNHLEEAKRIFLKVANEIAQLKVDDDKLTQVMTLGFSATEARIGLRGCKGNVEQAVQYLIRREEEKKEIKRKEREERKKKEYQTKLGKTLNGEWMNVDCFNSLVSMGYSTKQSRAALRQSNNNISLAVQILQDQQQLLQIEDNNNNDDTFALDDIPEEVIARLVSLGFNIKMVQEALKLFGGNPDRAAEHLCSGGILSDSDSLAASTSSSTSILSSISQENLQKRAAMERLAEDIPEHDEDYLDLTLQEEEMYLKEYFALLDMPYI